MADEEVTIVDGVPQCADCVHFHIDVTDRNECDAFPKGIPNDIILNKVDHTKPVEGDHGIQYEQVPAELLALFDADKE
jgi:hypothetical protein